MSHGTGKRSFVAGVTSFLGDLVPGFRRYLPEQLDNKDFREEYASNHVRRGIAYQIRAMREARKMKQGDLAKILGKPQSNVARLEDPNYGKFSLQTLLEIANGFDVWLSVQFVPFSEGLRRTEVLTPEALNARSFVDERENDLLPSRGNVSVETSNNVIISSFWHPIVESESGDQTTTGIVIVGKDYPQAIKTAPGIIVVKPALPARGSHAWN